MKKMRIAQCDYIKANRKASREAEIENHSHPVNYYRVQKSKKVYNRKRSKAEHKKALPYLFLDSTSIIPILMRGTCLNATDNYFFHCFAFLFNYLLVSIRRKKTKWN